MPTIIQSDNTSPPLMATLLACLIPGAGHFYLGKRQRGIIMFIAICGTFLLGVIIGGIEVVEFRKIVTGGGGQEIVRHNPWFAAQILAGLPAIIFTNIQDKYTMMGYGHGVNIGLVYTGVAGLLNLLCIMDTLVPTAPASADHLDKKDA